jgi:hypothetical protein
VGATWVVPDPSGYPPPLILVLRPFHYGYGYEWTTMYPRGPNVFAGGSIAFGRGLTINRQTISLFSQIIAADLLRRGQIKGVNKKGPSVFTGLLSHFGKKRCSFLKGWLVKNETIKTLLRCF